VRPRSFVNKVGTGALLLAARELGLEAHALAPTAKFLPARAPLLALPERPPSQVWDAAPAGVRVTNPVFEEISLALLRSVVTERGFLPPGEAGSVAENVVLPAELLVSPGEGAT
jgi:translation initiation factor 2B subunit (eIF-2B alpha/beta/delta family)